MSGDCRTNIAHGGNILPKNWTTPASLTHLFMYVDAGAGLDIVEMDIAVLRDQVHHRVLLGDLHRKLQ